MRSILETIGMASDLFILLLVFAAVVLVVWALSYTLLKRSNVQARLNKLTTTSGQETEAAEAKKPLIESDQKQGFLDRILSPLHRFALPSDTDLKRRLRLRLVQAGFRSKRAFRIFLGAKVLMTLLLPGLYLFETMVVITAKLNPQTIMIVALLALAGLYAPNLFLNMLVNARQARILRGLPDALDLMVICVEAGLGLDMTFKRVGDEMRPLCVDLSDEFYLVNREVRAGKSRDEAFRHMAQRTGVSEVNNLMTVLTQTSRFGTSVAKALRVHADAMRIRRRQNAEERAAKASVKLVFPLIGFIFPAILVVVSGPAVLRVMSAVLPVFGGG